VTLLVQSRPDPTKDAEVTGLVNAQVTVANRFAQAQVGTSRAISKACIDIRAVAQRVVGL
jgi:hypothetical protein